jgi:hypothetical protein
MAHEKQYTAKQAANAVLEKVGEILKKSELLKADGSFNAKPGRGETGGEKGVHMPLGDKAGGGNDPKRSAAGLFSTAGKRDLNSGSAMKRDYGRMKISAAKDAHKKVLGEIKDMPAPNLPKSEDMQKYETENSNKLGYKLSDEGKEEKQPEKSDKAFEVKGKESKSSNDARLAGQTDPHDNPKEQAEGNNPPAGAEPKNQVEQPGNFTKGHMKLAKFIGRMEGKRLSKKQEIEKAETGHEKGVHPQGIVAGKPVGTDAGTSLAGDAARSKHQWANQQHRKVLNEIKTMPKPKLPG